MKNTDQKNNIKTMGLYMCFLLSVCLAWNQGAIMLGGIASATENPRWTPISGQYSMIIYGQAGIEDDKIGTGGYMIAAFGPGGESDCRGITDFINFGGEWGYYLTIVSNNEGEEISFKIWNGSSGEIFTIKVTITFEADAFIKKNLDISLKLESVYPAAGKVGDDLEVMLTGSGFDENTRVFAYLDVGSKKSIIGSVDTPGYANDVDLNGATAYIADREGGLQIIDVSDLSKPEIIASVDTPGISQVVVEGKIAYILCNSFGLKLIDLSDSESPDIIGSLELSECYGMAISGTKAYITNKDRLQIIDIIDPSTPNIIGSLELSDAGDVAVEGTIAYVANGWSGLQIIDVSVPEKPTIISTENLFRYVTEIFVSDMTAYVISVNISASNLTILDISDSANPAFVKSVDFLYHINSAIKVFGKNAYMAGGDSLNVIDITNSSIVGYVDTPGSASEVTVADTVAYVADGFSGLQVIDVTKLAPFPIISHVQTFRAYDVKVSGSIAYVAHREGLQVVNVSDPNNPSIISSVDIPYCSGIEVSDNITYMLSHDGGFHIVDVSDPTNPTIIGNVDRQTQMSSYGLSRPVTLSGTTIYIADYENGLQVIDVSDPTNPIFISSVETIKHAYDVKISGTIAYVAAGDEGLQIIDVSNPANPVIISSVKMQVCLGVEVDDAISYVATGDEGLQIIDVSDPTNPSVIASAPCGYASKVLISGITAYVLDSYNGLQVIDISNSPYPTIIGFVDMGIGNNEAVTLSGTTAYVADSTDGLLIINVPSVLEISRNIHNATEISLTISDINLPGYYTIKLFNGEESYELPGAVTFMNPEDYLDMTRKKAIIVAGGDSYSDDPLWLATQKCTNLAYIALLKQGYTKENIYFLSPENIDIDGDGKWDDIDSDNTYDNLEYTINTWAKENTDELILYMTGHGSDNIFHLNQDSNSGILSAEILDKWLDDLQTTISEKVIFIYDACMSGSFIPSMIPPAEKERIVITSASENENAWFAMSDGMLSFSYPFWTSVLLEGRLQRAFFNGKTIIEDEGQTSMVDSNGDGIVNEKMDYYLTGQVTIGRGWAAASLPHAINKVSEELILSGETTATIWASDITPSTDIRRVWAIIPPDYIQESPDVPITDIPTIELEDPDNNGKYEGIYENFTKEGSYKIIIYAMNSQEVYSLPETTKVIQTLPPNWTKISGSVLDENGTLLCGAVVANGQYMFSCAPDGEYNLKVPLNDNGKITLFCFADSFAPFRKTMTPEQAIDFEIIMSTAPPDSPSMNMTHKIEPVDRPDYVKITGEVLAEDDETPLCSMVLANGQHMFSCEDNLGKYEMEVPLNETGEITLFGFTDGFQPFKRIFECTANSEGIVENCQ
ncbi:MAG: hypothetical protein GY749_37145 [Desulfobacteraceae bacterium]|nr:hypothetical protein [Desulfobacteraceae bacterium]